MGYPQCRLKLARFRGVTDAEFEDNPQPDATREALANAFCHRDYSVAGGDVSIAIYDDRLEIRSTGSLPGGLTPEDLRKPHASMPRDPSIARVLHSRGIIEQWGRGTNRMMDLAKQAGLPLPEFEDRGGQVTVRFRPSVYQPPKLVQHPLTVRTPSGRGPNVQVSLMGSCAS